MNFKKKQLDILKSILEKPGYLGDIYQDSSNEFKIILEKSKVWDKIGSIKPYDEYLNIRAQVLFYLSRLVRFILWIATNNIT